MNWHEMFFEIARVVAKKSPDKIKQVGAVVVSPNNQLLGFGYNAYPQKANVFMLPETDAKSEKWTDTKEPYICHAEANAIFNSSVKVNDCKLYCLHFPCNECAKVIIQSGIKEVHYLYNLCPTKPKYVASAFLFSISKVKTYQHQENSL